MPQEDAGELDTLARAYEADLRPRDDRERAAVARIVTFAWRLRRVARAEQAMWEAAADVHAGGARAAAAMFSQPTVSTLERLSVYEQRFGRAFHAAVREFHAARKRSAERLVRVEDVGARNEATEGGTIRDYFTVFPDLQNGERARRLNSDEACHGVSGIESRIRGP